jgi:site-specific DNA recombinase
MKNAIAYYRVSSAYQAETQSIDLQKNRIAKFVKKNGEYKIVGEFQDDGISGETIESRPGFKEVLAKIKTGNIDVLLVYMIDRVGRFSSRKDRNYVIELLEDSKTSVHSPYHGLFRYDNEKEFNQLEAHLNDSRADNLLRAIRISEGHQTKRLKGRFSGGTTPYGIGWNKKDKGEWYEVPAEVETLKFIFQKLSSGWGLARVRDYLNENPDDYPKRERLYKGKPSKLWNEAGIHYIVKSDFYFTGVIPLTKAAKDKGVEPMDTGIKLLDEKTVKTARREMANRRVRNIDPSLKNRKHTHGQIGKTVFTDALLHGIAVCGVCGWKLGLQKVESGKYNYLYYACRGRGKKFCNSKNIRADYLDAQVWHEFINTLQKPEKVKEAILNQDFIFDKDLQAKKSEYDKAKTELERITGAIERTKKQYRWNHLTDNEYKTEISHLNRIRNNIKDKVAKIKKILERPKDVREAVSKATEHLAVELEALEMVNEIRRILKSRGETRFKRRLRFPNDPELFALFKRRENAMVVLDRLDSADRDVETLIFQQKRAMLQKFIDPAKDKSIQVYSAKKFDLHFRISFDLFNDFGDKKRENKQPDREKYFKRNQFGPVTRGPNLF